MIRLGQCFIFLGIIALVLPVGSILLLPGLFMIGLGCAPIFPSLLHETPRSFGKENSQAIMGIQMASAYIGTTLMPPLFGQIGSHIGFSVFPLFIVTILVLQIIVIETMNRKIDKNNVY